MRVTAMALLVAAIWGLSPIFEKMSLRGAPTAVVMTIRLLFIAACVAIFAVATGRVPAMFEISGKTLFLILLSGLLGGILGLSVFFAALKNGEASYVIPLAATAPLFTAFYAWALLGEKLTLTRVAGIALIVAGAALVYWTRKP